MPNNNNDSQPVLANVLSSAVKLTPLELNNIRLDVRHTVLTPDYLEKLMKKES